MINEGVNASLAARDATRNGNDSHTLGTGARRHVQAARECSYSEFLKYKPLDFKGTEGVVELTRWFEKMKSVFSISNCTASNQVKFTTCTLQDDALTWWNSYVKTTTPEEVYAMTWATLKKKMTGKYCPRGKIKKIETEMWNLKVKSTDVASKSKTMQEVIEFTTELMEDKTRAYAERQADNKRKSEDIDLGLYVPSEITIMKGNGCFECGAQGHFKRNYPKLKNNDCGNQAGNNRAPARVYVVGNAGANPDNVGARTFLLNDHCALILFDTGADKSFVSTAFKLGSFDVIVGMDWLKTYHAVIVCDEKIVRVPFENETLIIQCNGSNNKNQLNIISCTKTRKYLLKGYPVFLANITTKMIKDKSNEKQLEDVPIVRDFSEVFPEDLPGLPPTRQVEFQIDLIPGVAPVALALYRLAPFEMKELSDQLQELYDKGFIRPSSSPWG
nr:hypothetical protein [Tanacetum cinerariifolium]